MWKTLWFNILTLLLYTAASFGLAWLVSPDDLTVLIFGGALAYGCSNVHFVLWFMAYTRERKEQQDGLLEGSQDELLL
ncbi:MAG: hypothetical protein AAFX99_18430 [Myxococcota bacterium]